MDELAERKQEIASHIQERTGYVFQDDALILVAMTHSSAKEDGLDCNERLEFLGDAVLGHIACEHLFKVFPDQQEGDLSVIKSILVSAKILAKAGQELGLDQVVITGKGIGDKKLPKSILANAFEALTAAIYLDSDVETVRKFLMDHLIAPYLPEIADNPAQKNFKSMLQDYAQKSGMPLPGYRVAKSVGPDHRKRFQVIVEVNGTTYGPTWGYSKKEAEQKAARNALVEIGLLPPEGEN